MLRRSHCPRKWGDDRAVLKSRLACDLRDPTPLPRFRAAAACPIYPGLHRIKRAVTPCPNPGLDASGQRAGNLVARCMADVMIEEAKSVLQTYDRPCVECRHHKRIGPIGFGGSSICTKNLMAIVPDMHVSYYAEPSTEHGRPGLCFESLN